MELIIEIPAKIEQSMVPVSVALGIGCFGSITEAS